MDKIRHLPRGVLILGLVSLLTDISSEAVYPLFPVFLTVNLGASILFLGVFEGVSECIASISKFLIGKTSDTYPSKKWFVISGYALANTARPLIGIVTLPWHALALRTIDRLGKGLRSAPRDAWLSRFGKPEDRAWIFGIHRSFDHAGAAIGTGLGALFLFYYPGSIRNLFLLTLIPGLLAVLMSALAEEPSGVSKTVVDSDKKPPLPKSFISYLFALTPYSLANSSDAFLLLFLHEQGLSTFLLPVSWMALHIIRSGSAGYLTTFSKKYGALTSIQIGWIIFAAVYLTFGLSQSLVVTLFAFLVYGFSSGLIEGPEKAYISDLVAQNARGHAYGLYYLVTGFSALPASILAGYLGGGYGLRFAFIGSALLTLISIVAVTKLKKPTQAVSL